MKTNCSSFLGFITAIALSATFSACTGGNSGRKFNPQERESSMTDARREEALNQKHSELEISIDTLLYGHGVRFAIVQPKVQGDITQDIAERIGMKMLQIASQNGISGVGSCNFLLGTEIAETGRATIGTAPQKMNVNYELTFMVVNAVTGDVYATEVQQIMGVGNSFVEANQNAVKEIKNTPQMQKMLQTASNRIIDWYNTNLQVVKNQVERAEGEGNYALALSILNSIPEQVVNAYKYVTEKQDALLEGMLHKQAAAMLGEMEAVLASSGDEFNPAVGAYFGLIPTDTPEHATAQKLYADYEKKCNERRAALEAKAERDEQAARELEKLKMLYDHETELATIEADKVKAKYESQAAAEAAEASNNKGFWGGLGDRILGSIDFLGEKFSETFDF